MDLTPELKERFDRMPLEDVRLNAALLNTSNDQMEEVWAYVFDRQRSGNIGPLEVDDDEEE